MTGGFFPEDLRSRSDITGRIADFVEIITTDGVEAAAKEALAQ